MRADEATAKLEDLIERLEAVKEHIDADDTSDYDVESRLNAVGEHIDGLEAYIAE